MAGRILTAFWVDERYEGRHGIGRYSREVLPRISVPWRPLGLSNRVASGVDAVSGGYRMSKHDALYSPGYAGFISSARQILTLHDLIHLEHSWPKRFQYLAYYDLLVRPLVKRAGLVFTVSETSVSILAEWLNDDSVAIINTGNACSDVFVPSVSESEAPDEALLFIGNLRQHKNAQLAFSIMRHLPDLRLRVLVPPGEVGDARLLAQRLGVHTQVDFLPSLSDDELASEYRKSVATVMPSAVEGFGLPALESVCCGTPVIYWEGCGAIGEAALGHGYPVPTLDDPRAWACVVESVIRGGTPISLTSRPSWDEVAARVDTRLNEFV
jgi:glycosyltransferase involved in cell wall biosynthesis